MNRQTDRDRGEDTHLNRHKLITNRTQVQNKGRKKTKGGNKREKHKNYKIKWEMTKPNPQTITILISGWSVALYFRTITQAAVP